MELRNALNTQLGVELPPTVTFDYPSVDALATYVATLVSNGSPTDNPQSGYTPTIAALSEDEISAIR